MNRCDWCVGDATYEKYHDEEWGVPMHDDTKLFEMLTLEGAQAGLSWITILKRREGYRDVFDHYDYQKIALYTDEMLEEKLKDTRIIRNRLKVYSVRNNARAFIRVQEEYGSFDAFIWRFTGGKTIENHFERVSDLPATTEISDQLSKALKKHGFKFIGSTICYALMQSIGMVDDHITSCFKYTSRAKA